MIRRNINGALLAIVMLAATAGPSLARGNDIVIKDGFGEEIGVKNGFFGRKTTVVKDRLGNGYATKNGFFGSKQTDVNVLGNSFQKKKGLFGGTNVSGSTIFGDKVTTKKGLFGRRTTTIDASGTSSVVRDLWLKNKSKILGTNPSSEMGSTNGTGSLDGNNGAYRQSAPFNDSNNGAVPGN